MKLYVGNLLFRTTAEELTTLFSEYGSVASVALIKDHISGDSKGFGFVEMSSNAEADKAIKGLNGHSFQGRLIKVNQVQAKQVKSRGKPRRRY